MKKILKLLPFFILSLSIGIGAVYAQDNSLQGTWKLDSVVLYKYVDNNDSTIIESNELLLNHTHGIFSTLTFIDAKCKTTINNRVIEAAYSIEGKTFYLNFFIVPLDYAIIENNEQLVLFHKFYDRKTDTRYGAKLTYTK